MKRSPWVVSTSCIFGDDHAENLVRRAQLAGLFLEERELRSSTKSCRRFYLP